MELWQNRVVEEKTELDARIKKLKFFIEFSSEFGWLAQRRQDMLNLQLSVMESYALILKQRIDDFTNEP